MNYDIFFKKKKKKEKELLQVYNLNSIEGLYVALNCDTVKGNLLVLGLIHVSGRYFTDQQDKKIKTIRYMPVNQMF